MKELGEHPHVLRFLGAVTRSLPYCLAIELASDGNLLHLLRRNRPQTDGGAPNLSLTELYSFAWQVLLLLPTSSLHTSVAGVAHWSWSRTLLSRHRAGQRRKPPPPPPPQSTPDRRRGAQPQSHRALLLRLAGPTSSSHFFPPYIGGWGRPLELEPNPTVSPSSWPATETSSTSSAAIDPRPTAGRPTSVSPSSTPSLGRSYFFFPLLPSIHRWLGSPTGAGAEPYCLAIELASDGNLLHLLRRNRPQTDGGAPNLSLTELYSFAWQVLLLLPTSSLHTSVAGVAHWSWSRTLLSRHRAGQRRKPPPPPPPQSTPDRRRGAQPQSHRALLLRLAGPTSSSHFFPPYIGGWGRPLELEPNPTVSPSSWPATETSSTSSAAIDPRPTAGRPTSVSPSSTPSLGRSYFFFPLLPSIHRWLGSPTGAGAEPYCLAIELASDGNLLHLLRRNRPQTDGGAPNLSLTELYSFAWQVLLLLPTSSLHTSVAGVAHWSWSRTLLSRHRAGQRRKPPPPPPPQSTPDRRRGAQPQSHRALLLRLAGPTSSSHFFPPYIGGWGRPLELEPNPTVSPSSWPATETSSTSSAAIDPRPTAGRPTSVSPSSTPSLGRSYFFFPLLPSIHRWLGSPTGAGAEPYCLAIELASDGNLLHLLRRNRPQTDGGAPNLSLTELYSFAWQVLLLLPTSSLHTSVAGVAHWSWSRTLLSRHRAGQRRKPPPPPPPQSTPDRRRGAQPQSHRALLLRLAGPTSSSHFFPPYIGGWGRPLELEPNRGAKLTKGLSVKRGSVLTNWRVRGACLPEQIKSSPTNVPWP